MATLDLDGVSLFWSEQGTGTPLLFVHGIPTDYRTWEVQVQGLSDAFRTITYSRRYAFPNSRRGDVSDSTVENNATDLAGLIGKLGLPPVHVVAHSYGGFVAAYLALHEPARLRSLTLVEPAIASLLLRDPRSTWQKIALLLRHPGVALSAQRYLKQSNDPALAALRRGDPAAAVGFNLDGIEDRHGAFGLLSAPIQAMMLANSKTILEADTPFPAVSHRELSGLRVPTLVMHGQTSARWLRAISQMTAAAIPGAEIVQIPGSGHFPHLQNSSAFNGALRTFLQRVDSSH